MSTVIVNIPGARILSSRGSGSNGRQNRWEKGREIADHRLGANANVARALCKHVGCRAEVLRWTDAGPFLVVRSYSFASRPDEPALSPARRVTLIRITIEADGSPAS